MSAPSQMHKAWLVRWFCKQHVEETPLNETARDEIARAIRTQAALAASIGERVNPIFMREVIRLFEELHEVFEGRHPDLDQNAALTVNNKPDLIDQLNRALNKEIADLLAHTEPMNRRAEDKVSA